MKKEKTMGRPSLTARKWLAVLVCSLSGFYANAQCDGCNLNIDGDPVVTLYSTHRYTVTNYDTSHPYGYWDIFGCDLVDEGIDADGEPYIDVYITDEYGATVTYDDSAPGWYQYGEYAIVVEP